MLVEVVRVEEEVAQSESYDELPTRPHGVVPGSLEDWRLATGVATWRNGGIYELATGVVPEVLKVLEVAAPHA